MKYSENLDDERSNMIFSTFKKLVIIILVIIAGFILTGCSSQKQCKEVEILNGEVLFIYPSSKFNCRNIVLRDKTFRCYYIYYVPIDAPLKDIPGCKYRRDYIYLKR